MAIKKSQLYSTLFESCNALRGSMDASQYKDYVLMILFVKYLSDKAHQGETDIKVPEGCYFEDFVALKQNEHIGEQINKKLEKIRDENAAFIGDLALPNFNDDTKLGTGKTKVETLSKLIGVFERDELNFSYNRASDDDLLGDAYEFLMKKFAVDSGKSKGQFYTPAEVSRVIAKILHLEDLTRARDTIYDMTCGSGSLLLRALNETNGNPILYGQEKDSSTAALAKLNMLLHGIVSAEIKVGDTLNDPKFTTYNMLNTFNVCVANPPFSQKNWLNSGGENDEYHRWNPNLLPPAKCGDFAFLLHFICSMKPDEGRGACIMPHGVLFRGHAEYNIRKHIVEQRYIRGIIGLPTNLFFGTPIPACIIVLDKRDTKHQEGIFFIDAKDCFVKDGNKNRLREQDIKRIIDTWDGKLTVPHYSRFVKWEEIEANDYNLNIPRYIQPEDKEVQHDIDAHLRGGLPETDILRMNRYWDICPSLRTELFSPSEYNRYRLKPSLSDIEKTVAANADFLAQGQLFEQSLTEWQQAVQPLMKTIQKGCKPKQLIADWSERLLTIAKADRSLVDAYDAYDQLMNYWTDTMQDDCYMVANDGWTLPKMRAVKVTTSKDKKTGQSKVKETACTYEAIVCDLLPVQIVLDEYFEDEQAVIRKAQGEVDEITGSLDDYVAKYEDVFDIFDKVNESAVKAAIKNADKLKLDAEAVKVCKGYLDIIQRKKKANAKLSKLKDELTEKVIAKYDTFTPDDVCRLVVDKKWLPAVLTACREEMKCVTRQLTSEVESLATRYEHTLPELADEVSEYESEVNGYLREMGFEL